MKNNSDQKTYIALLRGINVGGNNIIKMVNLKLAFEEMGFSNVKTYIQSGNVIFSSDRKNKVELTDEIEKKLLENFSYNSIIVLRTKEELEEQLASAPKNYGVDNENYRYDVIFLKDTITVDEAIKDITLREAIDEVFVGNNILFFRRLFINLTKSKLGKS